MSAPSVGSRTLLAELTVDTVLNALKLGLKGKFSDLRIQKAIGDMKADEGWFEPKQIKTVEDLLKLEWSGVLQKHGLPLSEDEVSSVLQTAIQHMKPGKHSNQQQGHQQGVETSLQSLESENTASTLEESGSNIDLINEEDVMKVVHDVTTTGTDTTAQGRRVSQAEARPHQDEES